MRHLVFLVLTATFCLSQEISANQTCNELFFNSAHLSLRGSLESQTKQLFGEAPAETVQGSFLGYSLWDTKNFAAWKKETQIVDEDMQDTILKYATGIYPPTDAVPRWVLAALQDRHNTFIEVLTVAHRQADRLAVQYYTELSMRMRHLLNLFQPERVSFLEYEVNEYEPDEIASFYVERLAKLRSRSVQFPVNFYLNKKMNDDTPHPLHILGDDSQHAWIYHTFMNTSLVEARLRWLTHVDPQMPFVFMKPKEQKQLVMFFSAYPELVDTVRVWPELGFDASRFELDLRTPTPQSASAFLNLGRYPKQFYGFLTANHDLGENGRLTTSLTLTLKKNVKNVSTTTFNKNEQRTTKKYIEDAWKSFAKKAQLDSSGFNLDIVFLKNRVQIEVQGIATLTERNAMLAEFFVGLKPNLAKH